MKLFIKAYNRLITDDPIVLDVEPNDTILKVKEKLYEKNDTFPIDYFSFIFDGIYLKDNMTLSDYNIKNESKIWQHIPCSRCGTEAIKKGNITDIESHLKGGKGVFLIIKCKCSNEDYYMHLNLEINKEYDINKYPLKCSLCGNKITSFDIKSVGFYQCACIFYNYLIRRIIESNNKAEFRYKDNTQNIFTLKLIEIYDD